MGAACLNRGCNEVVQAISGDCAVRVNGWTAVEFRYWMIDAEINISRCPKSSNRRVLSIFLVAGYATVWDATGKGVAVA